MQTPTKQNTLAPTSTTGLQPLAITKTPATQELTEVLPAEIISISNATEISTIFTIHPDKAIGSFEWANDSEFLLTFSESEIRFYKPPAFQLVDSRTRPNNNFYYGWLLDKGSLLGIDTLRDIHVGVWNYETDETSLYFEIPWYSVYAYEINTDGSRILIWGEEQIGQQAIAQIMNVYNGEVVQVFSNLGSKINICSIAVDPTFTLLATSVCARDPNENIVTIWNVETGEKLYDLPDHFRNGAFTKFDPSGNFLAVFSDDFVNIWNLKDRTWDAQVITKSYGNQINLLFTSDIHLIAHYTGYENKRLILYDTGGEIISEIPEVSSAAFSPDGRYLAILKSGGELNILGVSK